MKKTEKEKSQNKSDCGESVVCVCDCYVIPPPHPTSWGWTREHAISNNECEKNIHKKMKEQRCNRKIHHLNTCLSYRCHFAFLYMIFSLPFVQIQFQYIDRATHQNILSTAAHIHARESSFFFFSIEQSSHVCIKCTHTRIHRTVVRRMELHSIFFRSMEWYGIQCWKNSPLMILCLRRQRQWRCEIIQIRTNEQKREKNLKKEKMVMRWWLLRGEQKKKWKTSLKMENDLAFGTRYCALLAAWIEWSARQMLKAHNNNNFHRSIHPFIHSFHIDRMSHGI